MSLAECIWGEGELARRHEILDALKHYPLRTTCKNPFRLSRKELWTSRVRQNIELLDLKLKLGWTPQHYLDALRIVCPDVASLGVNYRIFLRNLEAQMTPEQQAYWLPKAQNGEISGCYAQTELGHGSNVSGLETTATFDPLTDELILNSPTLSSYKYWIGSLGVIATHALVVARLIVKGKDLGIHVFIVQVRDLDTHELMPSVTIYEQGEKALGTFASMDNGVMRLANTRISRTQMLSRFAVLERDGTYRQTAGVDRKKHAYTSMLIIRGLMVQEVGCDVAKALVIALRYLAFRRQFHRGTNDGEEMPVIQYASVQHRLYPALCRAVAMVLVGRDVKERVDRLQSTDLEDLHLQTVGLKIWATEHGVRDVEVARLSCGGHGNMAAGGLGSIYAQLSPTRTYEGDSFVLAQQIGKAVVKHCKSNSDWATGALSYLRLISKSPTLITDDTEQGIDTSYTVFKLAMAHADLIFWRGLQRRVDTASGELALTTALGGLEVFTGTEFISLGDITGLRDGLRKAIRIFTDHGHVSSIVSAWGFTETELNSVFTRDGQTPYEALVETARASEMSDNQFIRAELIRARNLWKEYQQGRANL
ncbi:acyl-CoA dehydrogenase/oxidase [Aspergillus heterothallicus]